MLLLATSLSFLHFRSSSPPPLTNPPPPATPRPLHFLRLRLSNSSIVRGLRFDAPASIETGHVIEESDDDLVVETCLTRSLTPALTLEHGLRRIEAAVEELKLDPPSSSSGVLRFQVAVPPSAKALSWFCCQPEPSTVYPLFFVAKETENASSKSLYVNETRGVFGIGAAIHFTSSSSSRSPIKRILSDGSGAIVAYGFTDIEYDQKSYLMKQEKGSYYFFVPQIELHEYEGASILAATIGWNESSPFEEAVRSYESCSNQVICHICSTTKKFHATYIRSTLRNLNFLADGIVSKVHLNMLLAGGNNILADSVALVSSLS